jgi:hypothetical protein
MSSLLSKNTYKQSDYPNLPLEGWLKPCVNRKCSIITSNTFIHNNVNYNLKSSIKIYKQYIKLTTKTGKEVIDPTQVYYQTVKD